MSFGALSRKKSSSGKGDGIAAMFSLLFALLFYLRENEN